MAQPGRRKVTWAACYIPRVWPIQICFHFYFMTTRVDAIKIRNSLWLSKSYYEMVTNQQGVRGQLHRYYPIGYSTQECFSFWIYKFTSPRSGKGVRTQFQGRAFQILLTKYHHLTSIIARLPFYLCRHLTSKRKEIEDRGWRHFKKHKKSFLYPTNFI